MADPFIACGYTQKHRGSMLHGLSVQKISIQKGKVKEGFSYPWKLGQHVGSKLSTSKSQLHCYMISV